MKTKAWYILLCHEHDILIGMKWGRPFLYIATGTIRYLTIKFEN